jgi:hypothetical protein
MQILQFSGELTGEYGKILGQIAGSDSWSRKWDFSLGLLENTFL